MLWRQGPDDRHGSAADQVPSDERRDLVGQARRLPSLEDVPLPEGVAEHELLKAAIVDLAKAKKLGMTDAEYGELLAVVGMFNQTNALAEAYKIPVDAVFMKPWSDPA